MFFSFFLNAQNKKQPNIILIMADDLGYECLNSYGGTSYKTPFLNKLASTGMQFENCHSQPICTPSRVRLMTGRSNKKNHIKFGFLDTKEKLLVKFLKRRLCNTNCRKMAIRKRRNSTKSFRFRRTYTMAINNLRKRLYRTRQKVCQSRIGD